MVYSRVLSVDTESNSNDPEFVVEYQSQEEDDQDDQEEDTGKVECSKHCKLPTD